MEREQFYSEIRQHLFGGKLTQKQVDGINIILDFWEDPPAKLLELQGEFKARWDTRRIEWLAYMFATTYHETNKTMQPITEKGGYHYFENHYGKNTKIGKRLGNTHKNDGAKFCGRGYVQLTGRGNYEKATKLIYSYDPDAPDFTLDPDMIKKPKYSVFILFYGMFLGIFTGKALHNYNKEQGFNYVNARKIINGNDRKEIIASYADKFGDALRKADSQEGFKATF